MGEYGEMDKKREGVKQRKAEGGRESQTQPNECLFVTVGKCGTGRGKVCSVTRKTARQHFER